jgi:hypothetical protein
MDQVHIIKGEYHYKQVSGVFRMVRPLKVAKRNSFITVYNDGTLTGGDHCRIQVKSDADFQYLTAGVDVPNVPVTFSYADKSPPVADEQTVETDDEAMDRIAEKFNVLEELSAGVIAGNLRSLIVTGPPGVGKSFGIEKQMEKSSIFDHLAEKKIRYKFIKGVISGIGMFVQLYKYSDSGNVLIFDDCDIWEDQDAINILKGALDSKNTRRISWNKDSRILREEGIPNTFDFKGSVIFITNNAFDSKRSGKIKPHLDALQDRSLFLDLTINTERDKILRVKQVHRDADGGLFAEYNFENGEGEEILEFMFEYKDRLRELSLRTCLKIADLVRHCPADWRNLAKHTVMR